MRILEISGDVGSTKYIADNLAKHLGEQNHHVDVIAPVIGRWDMKIIAHLLKNLNYDLIHAHLGNASIMAGRLGFLLNIPVLSTLHGFQKAKHYKNIKHFTAVSEAVKDHFIAQGIARTSIKVIHNGFEEKIKNKNEELFNDDKYKNRFIIGTAGGLSTVKRHKLIIEAMSHVVKKKPEALLIIAGEGYLQKELEKQIKVLQLENHVHLLGFVQEMSAFYSLLNMYVQTSPLEGFCMPILDAMACGLPVIATANGGSECFMDHDVNSIIQYKDNPLDMADSILSLINNPKKSKNLAEKAKSDVMNKTWKNISNQYIQYMQDIVNQK